MLFLFTVTEWGHVVYRAETHLIRLIRCRGALLTVRGQKSEVFFFYLSKRTLCFFIFMLNNSTICQCTSRQPPQQLHSEELKINVSFPPSPVSTPYIDTDKVILCKARCINHATDAGDYPSFLNAKVTLQGRIHSFIRVIFWKISFMGAVFADHEQCSNYRIKYEQIKGVF